MDLHFEGCSSACARTSLSMTVQANTGVAGCHAHALCSGRGCKVPVPWDFVIAGFQMNVLTNPSIKAKGHRTLPTPVAPPR